MAQNSCTSFGVKEKPIFSFHPCDSLAQESVILPLKGDGFPSNGLAARVQVSDSFSLRTGGLCVCRFTAYKEAYTVGGLLPGPKINWRQLPLIIISGLLIGAVFGGAIKAFAPEQTTMMARVKPRS
jgi:hypothetical protein